jgi:hypothetical protein
MTPRNLGVVGAAAIEDILCGSMACIDRRHRLYCGAY